MSAVKPVHIIVTLLLLALWLPASSHALLQHVGFIHQIHAHDEHADDGHAADSPGSHEHDTNNHDAADGLVLAPAGKVQAPLPVLAPMLAWLTLPLVMALHESSGSALHSGLSTPGTAPPELSPCWQFSSRTALPVRAPSLAS